MAAPGVVRVADPPARPLLLFDGDCGFCKAWVARWRLVTGDRIDYAPSQEAGARFPEITAGEFRRSVQIVLPGGEVRSGAHAIFTALAESGHRAPMWAYLAVPGLAPLSEAVYGLVARHRGAASAATRVLWGKDVSAPRFRLAAALFLRLLGVVFLFAFVSLWVQVHGLIGSRGILPVGSLLAAAAERYGAERFWLLPTVCWAASGDVALHVFCAAGTALSLALIAGFYPAACVALLATLYLSLSVAGQTFFLFQWDSLLVETAFLAIFLAPLSRRVRFSETGPSRLALFLLRWLLFRLTLSSGVVKLSSGDPTWRAWTALRYHYETQPLPPWTAWFMHQLPAGAQKASVLLMFFVELVVPIFVFGPRRLRLAAFGFLVAFQSLIFLTGNYAFFNVLSASLCVLLLDDRTLERFRRGASRQSQAPRPAPRLWPNRVVAAVALLVVPIGAFELAGAMGSEVSWPSPLVAAAQVAAPFRIVNGYGLFAVMTTRRPEIVIEGSADGRVWKAYEFRWKPGDPRRKPGFVAPHQPRLDWQMWFAALGEFEENPWFGQLLARLLQGSPDVISLFASNPFPEGPPHYVRARVWDYRFTDAAMRRRTGAWWRREEIGPYGPVWQGP